MTVSSTTRKAGPFLGNGVATAFPFTFKVFTTADIALTLTDSGGNNTPLTLNTHYSVALNADQDNNPGGTITYPLSGAPMPAGSQLIGLGSLAAVQGTDITNGGRFLPQVVEDAFDKLTVLVQQVLEKVNRGLAAPTSESTIGTLPSVASRASKFLAFDVNGNPIAASGTGADAGLRTDLAASSGAGLLGWLQAGTGALSRLIRDKLRDVVSVKDFGAKGDGVTDDTTAITNALTAATGGRLTFPIGSYVYNGSLTIPANTELVSTGGATLIVTTGSTFFLSSGSKVVGLGFSGAATRALQGIFVTTPTLVEVRDCTFTGCAIGVYVERGFDNSTAERWTVSGNKFVSCVVGFYAVRINRSIIERNDFATDPTSFNIQITGGEFNRIERNAFNGGVTAIGFTFQFSVATFRGLYRGNIIRGNTLRNIKEEGISFDIRGNVAADTSPRELDTVAATSSSGGNQFITLANAGWTSAGKPLVGEWVVFMTGTLAGQAFEIIDQTNNTGQLNLAMSPTVRALVTVGDSVAIGMPVLGNEICENSIELMDIAANPLSSGIALFGFCFGNRVAGNTITGPSRLGTQNGIWVTSLNGITAVGSVTNPASGRAAPSANNVVEGNTVHNARIYFKYQHFSTGGDYTVAGNRALNNTVIGDGIYWEKNGAAPTSVNNRTAFADSITV